MQLAQDMVVLTGIAQGATVSTLEGDLPVEYLTPGDRVITRSGARVLRAVTVTQVEAPMIRVQAGSLGHGRPGQDLLLGSETRVLLRDWRAKALFGRDQVLIEVAMLKDGRYVAEVSAHTNMFSLHFDMPEVIYVDGVELEADPEITCS
ncbi:hypothetical protein BFP70_01880 [Thioclava sp. SK-1]|nr:hypothetical protein BFP70_01880 [Thioclava sp. SK-1]